MNALRAFCVPAVAVLSFVRPSGSSGRPPPRPVPGNGQQPPHIVLIVADDLGWNDVGFHGSVQTPTPNIDALAYHGLILNRHYVLPTCTPSRAALLTGKHPIRYGLQGTPISAGEASALSLDETILPQRLKSLGYSTHLVGKWHMGSYQKAYLPTRRGFDSHFGYWNGFISYRNSTHVMGSMAGKDARRGTERAGDEMADRYATEMFTEEALNVIDTGKRRGGPMFLMVSHLAVHAGNKGPLHLDVANKTHNDVRFGYIADENRRLYAGMLTSLDESVGSIIESLDKNQMLENSIILFMSDNGAPTDDPLWGHENFGSNWPLRGQKGSLHDGGVRGVAAIWSPRLKRKHDVSDNLFHITDWLPTMYAAAGGHVEDLGRIDGVDQWTSLTDTSKSARSTVLINIDETRGEEALISGQWKVVKGNRTSDMSRNAKYNGDPGNVGPDYDMDGVMDSVAGTRLSRIGRSTTPDQRPSRVARDAASRAFRDVRSRARVQACAARVSDPDPNGSRYECFDGHCLYDLIADPCEYRNVAAQNPSPLATATAALARYRNQLVPQHRPGVDPDANPDRYGGYWDTWLENTAAGRSDHGHRP